MRRKYQEVEDRAVLEGWLAEATVGRLATVDEDGYPVVKPVNFAYADGRIYFHSAREGEKLDDIRRDPRVGFEVDRLFALVPALERGCQAHCFYQSLIVRGRARILDGDANRAAHDRALRLLVDKHAPDFAGTPLQDPDQAAVVEIAVERMTGKEDFGQRWSPERKLAVARALLARDGEAAADVVARMGLSIEQASG
jgi:nitroimidazol reductase NimA-like FMN-containing flavoprotein (pyridoxamine 5'-phosphate oxidase superfamily)